MERTKALLWDIDGTLLDFGASERAGIRTCFGLFGLGTCTDEMLAVYDEINNRYWEMLERGECTKHQTMVGRFVEFFALYGLHADVEAFNDEYQRRLPDTIVFRPHALDALHALAPKYRQYAVTNGNLPVQQRKLRESGLAAIFDGVFISDEVGFEKPSPAYFDFVLNRIGLAPSDCLVIGDSLTSDIRGANNAGIPCCWYNPDGKPQKGSLRIDAVVSDLSEVPAAAMRLLPVP